MDDSINILQFVQLEREQKKLENFILRKLSLYNALGEIKLLEMIQSRDKSDNINIELFYSALLNLISSDLIEVVSEKTNTMSVIRMKHVYH